jgi:hypothetical protein
MGPRRAPALWVLFTYVIDIAVHAPKLVFTFPERDAGKSAALGVLHWMVQRRSRRPTRRSIAVANGPGP